MVLGLLTNTLSFYSPQSKLLGAATSGEPGGQLKSLVRAVIHLPSTSLTKTMVRLQYVLYLYLVWNPNVCITVDISMTFSKICANCPLGLYSTPKSTFKWVWLSLINCSWILRRPNSAILLVDVSCSIFNITTRFFSKVLRQIICDYALKSILKARAYG